MKRILFLAIALGACIDVFRKALSVRADSFVVMLGIACIVLLILIFRDSRRWLRRRRRKNTDFIRPRSFPKQPRRPLR